MSSVKRKDSFLKLMITVCQAELIGDQAAAATDGTLIAALTAKRKSLMFIAGRLSAYLQDNGVVVDSVLETLDTSRNLNLMQEKTDGTKDEGHSTKEEVCDTSQESSSHI
jgi:hypothetical protein